MFGVFVCAGGQDEAVCHSLRSRGRPNDRMLLLLLLLLLLPRFVVLLVVGISWPVGPLVSGPVGPLASWSWYIGPVARWSAAFSPLARRPIVSV